MNSFAPRVTVSLLMLLCAVSTSTFSQTPSPTEAPADSVLAPRGEASPNVTTTGVTRSEVTLPGAGITLSGILFRPPTLESALPAVVVLHGWAEASVPGAPRVEGLARRIAKSGYVALALSMRGWPKSEGKDDCGSEQPDDIAKAVDWLASLPGVNPDRIGAIGLSQGGQVALLAAARSNRIRVVVAYYPVTDIRQWQRTTTNQGIRDYYIPRVCGFGTSRSPTSVAEKIGAAVLLIHGDRDTRVPTEQSIWMQRALQKANRTVDLQLIAGAEHGFDSTQTEQAWALTAKFLATYLAVNK
jgi:dipeptidyl aminopeptidase/acylaminoacyl peptidase